MRPHILPAFVLLTVCLFAGLLVLAPSSYATERSWLERFLSFEHNPASPLSPSERFVLKGVSLDTSCLIEQEQLMPLFKPYMGKYVNDATILDLMQHIRSVLGKKGFSSIQVRHEASNTDDGIVRLTIQAAAPMAMADVAREKCPNAPILVTPRSKAPQSVKNVLIGGMFALSPDAFLAQAREMQGKPFDAMDVIGLMQDIRAAYTRANEPLPYISFESALAEKGIIKLKVVEKKRRPKTVEYVSLESLSHENLGALPQPEVTTAPPLNRQPTTTQNKE